MTKNAVKPFHPRYATTRQACLFSPLACAFLLLLVVSGAFHALADDRDNPTLPPAQQQDRLAERHDHAWPTLMRSAWAGDIARVRTELDAGADANARSQTGSTALLAAAMKSHDEIVEILLEHNANVDGRNNPGNTALMVAVHNGDVAIVRLLLRHGADINVTNKRGESPFSIARSLGNKAILTLLQGIKT
ncbi:MAG: ankyrin repeat domain-containing protein [Mariprofundaceae bacterium]